LFYFFSQFIHYLANKPTEINEQENKFIKVIYSYDLKVNQKFP